MAAAIKLAREQASFDVMILDLLLPRRTGSPATADGGLETLRLLASDGQTPPAEHIVALTAFAELGESQMSELKNLGVLLLQYGEPYAWEDALAHLVNRACDRREARAGQFDCDVLWVCALHDIELEATLALPANWQPLSSGVYRGSINGLSCIATACPEMGMPVASAVVSDCLHQFHPRLVVMTGIAAGVDDGLNFGDVVVADVVWDYGAGKWMRDGSRSMFAPAPSQRRIDEALLRRTRMVRAQEWGTKTRLAWNERGRAPRTIPNVLIGPFASGAAVVQDEEVVARIRETHRKARAIDMEAYGVVVACQTTSAPRPFVFVCKAICDFADAEKDDRYQAYAAYTSASFAHEILMRFRVPD